MLEVKRDGFQVWANELTLAVRERHPIHVKLVPLPTPKLAEEAVPDKAAPEKATPEKTPTEKQDSDPVALRQGMYWNGTKVWTKPFVAFPQGTKQWISLQITQVSAPQFKGLLTFEWGKGARPVKGTIQGATIEWIGDGVASERFVGTIEGNSMKGECGNGTFAMQLR
jgi:hypothetical protein